MVDEIGKPIRLGGLLIEGDRVGRVGRSPTPTTTSSPCYGTPIPPCATPSSGATTSPSITTNPPVRRSRACGCWLSGAALTTVDDDSVVMLPAPVESGHRSRSTSVERCCAGPTPCTAPSIRETILGLAEQTTVMNVLTHRVIDDVTRQLARWRGRGLTLRSRSTSVPPRPVTAKTSSPVWNSGWRLMTCRLTCSRSRITECAHHRSDPGPGDASSDRRSRHRHLLDDFGTGFLLLQQIRGTPGGNPD